VGNSQKQQMPSILQPKDHEEVFNKLLVPKLNSKTISFNYNQPNENYVLLRFSFLPEKNTRRSSPSYLFRILNRNNKILGIYELSQGGITGTVADPRLIVAAALKANAVSIMLAHNHPSGSIKRSMQDEQLTEKIKQAQNFCGATVPIIPALHLHKLKICICLLSPFYKLPL
jgi:hypothetical protein